MMTTVRVERCVRQSKVQIWVLQTYLTRFYPQVVSIETVDFSEA